MNSTTCLHCGLSFDGGVEIIGRPNARMEALVTELGKHMAAKHPQILQAMQIDGAAYIGMLFLTNFKSSDEKLNLERDKGRWAVHQRTLNARFSDESLRQQSGSLAARLALLPLTEDMGIDVVAFSNILLEVFTGMRDDLEEPNRYSEAKAEQLAS